MGVYHFMGVGQAVGAITCAVDYIEQCLTLSKSGQLTNNPFFKGTGGISHKDKAGQIEALVFFTSKEVIHKSLKAFKYEGCDQPSFVRDELEKNLLKVWRSIDKDEGRKVFWVEVEINNFQDCFDKALKVARRFSPEGKQGKEIWLNLTGGSNSINLALMSMARFTGIATKHYLISQREDYRTEVSVPKSIAISPNHDGYFRFIPFLRTAIDSVNFYEILWQLQELNKPIITDELYGFIKSRAPSFPALDVEDFRRTYMLKLFGLGYTEYDLRTDMNTLTQYGAFFLEDLEELDRAMNWQDILSNSDKDWVEESKSWSWFYGPCQL